MMNVTHITIAVAATSICLGTADPLALSLSAIACQLPDADTSTSVPGRLLLPLSRFLEQRYPHRGITHSFAATGVFALLTLPVLWLQSEYWAALILGYFMGWFADAFTRSGVAAFYPSAAKLVIPGNPRLRLSTGSPSEYFVIGLMTIVAIAAINMNSSGGILRAFNAIIGIPEGAVEAINSDGSRHLMFAQIRGRNAVTLEPVEGEFEVVKTLTQSDLLVKNPQGTLFRAGTTQNCQILASRIATRQGSPIKATIKEIAMEDEDLETALAAVPDSDRTYINGMLSLEGAEDLRLLGSAQQFPTITIQPAAGAAIAHLESAAKREVIEQLGEFYATGTLTVRSVSVQP